MPQQNKSKYLVLVLLLAITIIVIVRISAHMAPGDPLIAADQRKPMSDILLTTLSDEKWSLADQRGMVVLVNFFATWCGPCVAETPDLIRVWRENNEAGFRAIGISVDEDGPAVVRPFVSRHQIPYSIGMLDPATEWGRPFVTQSVPIPLSFLIDKQGRIAKIYRGMASYSELNADVRALVSEP